MRKGETPWNLRNPPDTNRLEFKELRSVLLPAIAFGNQKQHTSPFLHTTVGVGVAWRIFGERRQLYSNYLVRIDREKLTGIGIIDLAPNKNGKKYLSDFDDDTGFLKQCAELARTYAVKDREVILLSRPKFEAIEYWDEEGKCWRSAAEARLKYSKATTASSQPSSETVEILCVFHLMISSVAGSLV